MHGLTNSRVTAEGRTVNISKQPVISLGARYMNEEGSISHEVGHAIMGELYGRGNLPRGGGGRHTLQSITNPGMAWIEGFAQFYASSVGANDDPDRLIFDRNPRDALRSEGLVARVLIDMDKKYGSREDIFAVMAETKPQNFADFLEAYIHKFPDRAEEVMRILAHVSSGNWPTQEQLNSFRANGFANIDLDGDGRSFGSDNPLKGSMSRVVAQNGGARSDTAGTREPSTATDPANGDSDVEPSRSDDSPTVDTDIPVGPVNNPGNSQIAQLDQQISELREKEAWHKRWNWIPFYRGRKLRGIRSQIASLESQRQSLSDTPVAMSMEGQSADPDEDLPENAIATDLGFGPEDGE